MLFQRLRDLREDRDLRQEDVAVILGQHRTIVSAAFAQSFAPSVQL